MWGTQAGRWSRATGPGLKPVKFWSLVPWPEGHGFYRLRRFATDDYAVVAPHPVAGSGDKGRTPGIQYLPWPHSSRTIARVLLSIRILGSFGDALLVRTDGIAATRIASTSLMCLGSLTINAEK